MDKNYLKEYHTKYRPVLNINNAIKRRKGSGIKILRIDRRAPEQLKPLIEEKKREVLEYDNSTKAESREIAKARKSEIDRKRSSDYFKRYKNAILINRRIARHPESRIKQIVVRGLSNDEINDLVTAKIKEFKEYKQSIKKTYKVDKEYHRKYTGRLFAKYPEAMSINRLIGYYANCGVETVKFKNKTKEEIDKDTSRAQRELESFKEKHGLRTKTKAHPVPYHIRHSVVININKRIQRRPNCNITPVSVKWKTKAEINKLVEEAEKKLCEFDNVPYVPITTDEVKTVEIKKEDDIPDKVLENISKEDVIGLRFLDEMLIKKTKKK